MGSLVYVRRVKDNVVIVGEKDKRLIEIASHKVGIPHSFVISEDHRGSDHPSGPLSRRPIPTNKTQARFLDLCPQASIWLQKACSAGVSNIEESISLLVYELDAPVGISVIAKSLERNSFTRSAISAFAKSITAELALGDRERELVSSFGANTEQWSKLKAVS